MVRLKDIAERAGVSVMTVSKVLRNAPDISPATKNRVRLLAEQMGYVPDTMAQALRTRTTKFLGLVISNISNPIFARTALAIEERAQELGYSLILAHSLQSIEREELCIRRLLSRRVDGLLISPVYRLAPSSLIFTEIAKNGTPTVIIGHRAPFCAQFANVETDDLSASYTTTQHLLGLGHRRIAFFAGPISAPWAQERLEGYKRALRDANIEPDDRLVYTAGGSIEEGAQAAVTLLEEGPQVTALQAVNDLVAIGAANIMLEKGRKIPADISIAGFGNILLSEHFRVPLTTVRQPKFRLGTAAMDVMGNLLKRQSAESKRLPAELIVRASTGPAPLGK